MLTEEINTVTVFLQQRGYKVEHGVVPPGCHSRVDIKATKGRRNLLWVVLASDQFDAAIAGWNLKSVRGGKKILYLMSGNALEVKTDKSILVVTKPDELPVN